MTGHVMFDFENGTIAMLTQVSVQELDLLSHNVWFNCGSGAF